VGSRFNLENESAKRTTETQMHKLSVVRFTDLVVIPRPFPALKVLGYFHAVRFADVFLIALMESVAYGLCRSYRLGYCYAMMRFVDHYCYTF
jgi:hypothetical protein